MHFKTSYSKLYFDTDVSFQHNLVFHINPEKTFHILIVTTKLFYLFKNSHRHSPNSRTDKLKETFTSIYLIRIDPNSSVLLGLF